MDRRRCCDHRVASASEWEAFITAPMSRIIECEECKRLADKDIERQRKNTARREMRADAVAWKERKEL
jgi:hypothetical protein